MKRATRKGIIMIAALFATSLMIAPGVISCDPVLITWCDFDLTAGQNYDAGLIEIYHYKKGSDYWIEIYIITEDGWKIDESHVHVDEGGDPIPATKKGNPKVGKFEYSKPDISSSTEHYFKVSVSGELSCGDLEIAVHAVVYKECGDQVWKETAWGGSEDFGGKNWALKLHFPCCKSPEFPEDVLIYMYFTTSGPGYWSITVKDDPNNPPSYDLDDYDNIWAGTFVGWCVDKDHNMYGNKNYWANLIDPKDDLTSGIEWDKINWIVNHRDGYNDDEVQQAIWYFSDGVEPSDSDAKNLRDAANLNGGGFHPSLGQWYVVITDTPQMNIIVLDP